MHHKLFQIKGITYQEVGNVMASMHIDLDPPLGIYEDYQMTFTNDEWDVCWKEAETFLNFWTKSWGQSVDKFIESCRRRLQRMRSACSPCPRCTPTEVQHVMLVVLAAMLQCISANPWLHFDVLVTDVLPGGKLGKISHVRPKDFFTFPEI
jgi:hypothetical protein